MSSMRSLGKQIARGFDSRQLHKLRQSSLTRRDSTVAHHSVGWGSIAYGTGLRPTQGQYIDALSGLIGFDSLLVGMTEGLFAINGKTIQMFNQPLRMVA